MACNFLPLPHRAVDVKNSDTMSEASESGTATSGLNSNWSSREDLRDFATKHGFKDVTDMYQERFKVDRKKMEQMLSGINEAIIPADVFFAKIMEDTDTYIIWPSKLKLGAKSKKEPHVRIVGKQENVQAAKDRIIAVLYSRCNRVTMKMDISYTDHSHIIGKGGFSIKRVMEETQCHVHFPDSNRSNPTEKSNQVSISGDIEGVETARSRVRELIPLIFGFEPPIRSQNIDNTNPYVVKIQEQYKVQVLFKTRSKLHATFVLVKGAVWEIKQVKEATILLMKYMCENLANQIPVQMSIQISPQHHQVVLGKNHSNLKAIIQYTKCQIMFPDALDQNIPSLKKTNVNISGSIDNVFMARQLLIGSLPLTIIFDLPDDTTGLRIKSEQINEIQANCDVTINIRHKTRQTIKACIIKGIEKHASNIYRARNLILGIDEPALVADIPANYYLPDIPTSPFPVSGQLATTSAANPSPISPLLNPMFTWNYPSQINFEGNSPSPFVSMMQKPQFLYSSVHQQSTNSSGFQSFSHVNSMMNSGNQTATQTDQNNSMLSSISSNDSSSMLSFLQSPSGSPYKYQHFPEQGVDEMETPSQTSDYQSLMTEKKLDRLSLNGDYSSTASTNYETTRLAGLKAMQNRPTPGLYRVPTNAWSGYGISHTSPAGFDWAEATRKTPPTKTSTSSTNNKDDDIWKMENYGNLPSISGLNSSNILDTTPSHIVNKVTSSNWTDLTSLLNSLGLERYVGLFVENEVDLPIFATFSDQDLIKIGVSAYGSRRKMLLAISELNKRSQVFSAAPGAERNRSTSQLSDNKSARHDW